VEVELPVIILIAAVARNGVIGLKGALPWHLEADLLHFKEVTMGHAVLFGRKTFESIPKPLTGRKVYVLSNDSKTRAPGLIDNVKCDVLLDYYLISKDKLFIAGGETTYRQFSSRASEALITHIDRDYEGDAFFPPGILESFAPAASEDRSENGVNFQFVRYIKALSYRDLP